MTTPVWQPGKLYPPGALVVPRTQPSSSQQAIANPGFEEGDTGWSKPAGWTIIQNPQAYQGDWFARYSGTGEGSLGSGTEFAVTPGQTITLSAYYRAPGEGDGAGGRVLLAWLDASKNPISISAPAANFHRTGHYDNWRLSSITASAPAAARFVRPAFSATINNGSFPVDVDSFSWNYAPPVTGGGLQYKAVQSAAGYSNTSEPAWPGVLGETVIDNEVTWEAVRLSRVVWEARPLLKSGATEPAWPAAPGARVADHTISWEAVSRRVEDPNCPNSKVTCIVASKVFKADRDIVRFSATANPLDWTTGRDAGYLPTGLQQANANDMAVLNQYRGNLVAFNASSFQMWQVDPDPAAMAILDQMDGIGSSWQRAAQPVGGELFYMSQQGVRTVGIANAASNLAAGDVGSAIDELVRDAMAGEVRPLSTYYPGAGQYWLAFSQPPEPEPEPDPITRWRFVAAGESGDSCPVVLYADSASKTWGVDAAPKWQEGFTYAAQYDIAVSPSGKAFIYAGDGWRGADTLLGAARINGTGLPPTRYQNPSNLTGYNGQDCAFHPDGNVVAFSFHHQAAQGPGQGVRAYAWDDVTGFGAQYPTPDALASVYTVRNIKFAGASALIVQRDGGPNAADVFEAYRWDTAAGFGAKFSEDAGAPANNSNGAPSTAGKIVVSPTGGAVAIAARDRLCYALRWSGATGFGAPYDPPGPIDGVEFAAAAFSPSGRAIVFVGYYGTVAHCYRWDDGAGFGEQYDAPILPSTSIGQSVSFSPDGSMIAFTFNNYPYVRVFAWDDATGLGEEFADADDYYFGQNVYDTAWVPA